MRHCIIIIFSFFVFISESYGQCFGGSAGASITPSTAWQTTCVMGGTYLTFSATAGRIYKFTFCSNGGSASFDTQITIQDNSGNPMSGGYNDDYCSYSSQVYYTPLTTATYRVLLNQYPCASSSVCATLAYSYVAGPDDPCTAVFLRTYCDNTTFTTYNTIGATNSTSVSNPSCGTYSGSDIWLKTVVPYSGSLQFNTQAGGITDAAMSVYKATSCSGTFTQLACNNNKTGTNLMPYISINSLTPGDTLYVRLWAPSNAQSGTLGVNIEDPNPTYCFSGTATQLFSNGCLRMTDGGVSESACIWNKSQMNLATNFDYTFTMNFGTQDGNGADGITFTMQNSAAGINALGATGSSLGASGISNSVIVEFDTFNNGAGVNDIADDHTAISLNGNLTAPVAGPIDASATSVNIEDGAYHSIRVTWNASTKTLSVYFDGSLRLTYTNDLVTNVFGSNMVYWGFTSSTGLYTNTQTVCPGTLPGAPLPVTWLSFDGKSNGTSITLNWETSSEEDAKMFVVERSEDGLSYSAIGTVMAGGNKKSISSYTFVDYNPTRGYAYYRLKAIDIDSKYSYSDIVTVNPVNTISTISTYPNPVSNGNTFIILVPESNEEEYVVEIYDSFGIQKFSQKYKGVNNSITIEEAFTGGMYTIYVSEGNKTYVDKLMVMSK